MVCVCVCVCVCVQRLVPYVTALIADEHESPAVRARAVHVRPRPLPAPPAPPATRPGLLPVPRAGGTPGRPT